MGKDKPIEFGTEKTSQEINGQLVTDIINYRSGDVNKKLKQFCVRVRVGSVQDEMTEFIRFSEDIGAKKKSGVLNHLYDDASTRPSFMIEYPRVDSDGSYFIIKTWTENSI